MNTKIIMKKAFDFLNTQIVSALIVSAAIPLYINYYSVAKEARASSNERRMLLLELEARESNIKNILLDSIVSANDVSASMASEYDELIMSISGNKATAFAGWRGNQFEKYNNQSLASLLMNFNSLLQHDDAAVFEIIDSIRKIPIYDTSKLFSSGIGVRYVQTIYQYESPDRSLRTDSSVNSREYFTALHINRKYFNAVFGISRKLETILETYRTDYMN